MVGLADNPMLVTVMLGALGTVLLLGLAFAGDGGAAKRVRRRLQRVGREKIPAADHIQEMSARRQGDGHSAFHLVEQLLGPFLPRRAVLEARLERTGRNIRVVDYALACLFSVSVIAALFGFLLDFPVLVSLLLGIACGLYLPHLVVGRMGARRTNAFMRDFPEAIDLLCRGLRAGLPISEAVNVVGVEASGPIGVEFKRVAADVRMGKSMEDALWGVSKRIDTPDFKFLVIAISIQRETGGNLAETLSALGNTLRKRRQMKQKIKALSSEALASAWIIGMLPFIMTGILGFLSPDYVGDLFSDPRGMMMTGVGLLMEVFGVGVMMKMIRFEI